VVSGHASVLLRVLTAVVVAVAALPVLVREVRAVVQGAGGWP